MATGGTVVLKKGEEYILFKVRHDGWELEKFFKDKKMAFKHDFEKSIPAFIKFFYPKGKPDYALQTGFPDGFKTVLKEQPDILDLIQDTDISAGEVIAEVVDKLEDQFKKYCEGKGLENDDLLCGYGGDLLLDFDSKLVFGISNDNDQERIYDENLKIYNSPPVDFIKSLSTAQLKKELGLREQKKITKSKKAK